MSSSRGFHLILSLVFILFSSHFAHAAKDAGALAKKMNGYLVFGVGAGPFTVTSPEHSMDYDGNAALWGSAEFRLIGPFHVSLGIDASASYGTMNYDFTGPDAIRYTGTDIKFQGVQNVGRAGMKFYLIDTGWFGLFAEAGGFFGGTSLSYTVAGTSTAAMGTKYETQQKNIWLAGGYYDSGIDLVGSKWGIRVGGRLYLGHSGNIHVLAEQRIKYQQALGYVALVFRP